VRVVDDGNSGNGTAVGTTGIVLQASLDNGRTWLPAENLGTANTWKVRLLVNGSYVDTGVQYDFSHAGASDKLKTGDNWSESRTTPPMWGTSDLFAAGPPAAGAFAAIAESTNQFGTIVITEPVQASDFATLVLGLNYGLQFDKKWKLIIRFRDPTAGESDAAYIAAFQAFAAANHDNRIECLAGSLYVTDAFRGYTWNRTFMGPYVARLASRRVVLGPNGERLAQNPGWVGRGPLEGASLKDAAGNIIGHDEATRGGIEAQNGAATGGGICCCYRRNVRVAGTYVTNRVTVMYGPNSAVLTPMDRDVLNAVEMLAIGVSLEGIGGSDIYDPETLELDAGIRDGLASAIASAIRDNYGTEFQNATDPGLVVINPTVTVAGAQVTISGVIKILLYGYTDAIVLTFAATR
jgi:hypothetical protein